MSNKTKTKVFVISNDYKYFYKLNRALKRLRILFKIVNFNDRLPNTPALLLTTENELEKLKSKNKNHVILPYDRKEDFEKYVFDILKIHNCGPDLHSELLFSIDPGDTIGLAVFLDGTFFYSHTFYSKKTLIVNIKKCVEKIEEGEDQKNGIKIIFKVGRGVFPLTLDLIETIYEMFCKKNELAIYMVNESKSSKIKFHKYFNNLSKHELSALILALRKGIKADQNNYVKFFELKKGNKEIKEKLEKELMDISFLTKERELLKKLISDLINCRICIDEAFKIIEQKKAISTFT